MREFRHHLVVDRSLEGHDESGKVIHLLPLPGVEFRRMAARRRIDADLVFFALEAEGEPPLGLAAIFALEADADQAWGKIVVDPVPRLPEQRYRPDSGFLIEFAIGGCERLLTLVYTPLGHLPELRGAIVLGIALGDAAAGPDKAVLVQHHHADAGTIGKVVNVQR